MSLAEDISAHESLDNSQEGKVARKVASSCLLTAVYLSYNLPVHSRREIDMAVFEAPL